MKHNTIKAECEALSLTVVRTPAAYGAGHAYNATGDGVRVYWTCSDITGIVLSCPRIVTVGDTHIRNIKELRYLVLGARKENVKKMQKEFDTYRRCVSV
jgi:hypothetical protein